MERFWMVWRDGGGTPVYKHCTEKSARLEAERLARLYPGSRFHVLMAMGSVVKPDVQWIEYIEIPF